MDKLYWLITMSIILFPGWFLKCFFDIVEPTMPRRLMWSYWISWIPGNLVACGYLSWIINYDFGIVMLIYDFLMVLLFCSFIQFIFLKTIYSMCCKMFFLVEEPLFPDHWFNENEFNLGD